MYAVFVVVSTTGVPVTPTVGVRSLQTPVGSNGAPSARFQATAPVAGSSA